MKATEKKKRRRFTSEFKAGAVRLVLEEGRTMAQVGADLGIHPSLVSIWVRQARADSGKGAEGTLMTSEKEELAKLRKEVRVLRMEREILKKAAAFFAKENT